MMSVIVQRCGGCGGQRVFDEKDVGSEGHCARCESLRKMPLSDLIRELAAATLSEVVDIRFTNNRFSVFLPRGNTMDIVPSSARATPEEAVLATLERWFSRSPADPFMASLCNGESWGVLGQTIAKAIDEEAGASMGPVAGFPDVQVAYLVNGDTLLASQCLPRRLGED